jgi:leucyl-tRNA synthetase
MEYMNTLRAGERRPRLEEVKPLVQLVSPFAPHVAEELWQQLGETESVFDSTWPSFDEALVTDDTVTMAVQVNGKTRGTITVSKTATQDEAMAALRRDPTIAKFITRDVKKVIFVAGRLINVVVSM